MNEQLRSACSGVIPLSGRLESWMVEACSDPPTLRALLDEHGSPLNVIDPEPLGRNAAELAAAARALDVGLDIHLARKANKALCLVDEASRLGLGIDLASERELEQVLNRGFDPARAVMTAAVKTRGLVELCVRAQSTLVIDNGDELARVGAIAGAAGCVAPIAIRLAPDLGPGRAETRFGLSPTAALHILDSRAEAERQAFRVEGVHFHLDGYAAADRVAAFAEALELIDGLRSRGHRVSWVDIGGGIPMSYLDSPSQWDQFKDEHSQALLGLRKPLTYDGHGLGLTPCEGEIAGRLNVYPAYQRPIRGEWLRSILSSQLDAGGTVAENLNRRGLRLRCEPGRSLLDGCGMTLASVEFRKRRRDGTWLIGLAMNRTQCRSTADEFPVDPLLLPVAPDSATTRTGAIEGYLVGAYCIERELLSWRRLSFPVGVGLGDIVVFPNTGGYMMHILESASHQIPLAKNIVHRQGTASLDPIDLPGA